LLRSVPAQRALGNAHPIGDFRISQVRCSRTLNPERVAIGPQGGFAQADGSRRISRRRSCSFFLSRGVRLLTVLKTGKPAKPAAGSNLLGGDVCIRTASILAWAIGKARVELRSYFADKGWKATVVSRQP
jgi:hypothetical protein